MEKSKNNGLNSPYDLPAMAEVQGRLDSMHVAAGFPRSYGEALVELSAVRADGGAKLRIPVGRMPSGNFDFGS